jgi:exopolysaccharide biosynthesis polyprenyl glycosylphosphotransferase
VIARHRARFAGFLIASDVVAIVVSFLYTYLFRFYSYIVPVDPAKGVPPLRNYLVLIPFFVATHLAVFFLQGFYKSRLRRTQLDDFFSIGVNAAITIVVVTLVMAYGVTYGRGEAKILGQPVIELSRVFVVVYFVGVVFTISFLRNQIYYLMKRRYARGKDLQNVLIVGAGEMGVTVAQKLHQYRDLGFVVRGFLADDRPAGSMILIDGGVPVLGRIDDLEAVIESQGIREIYVALDLSNYPKIVATLQIVNRFPVNVRLIPDLFQLLTLKANVQDLDGFPVISIDEVPLRGGWRVLKRLTDIVVSGLGLLLLSPFILIFAVLIKLTSRGPVFYHQERLGLDGRRFKMHKFRTMIRDAEKETGPVFCRADDPRVTRIGWFLRKYSIDELPQLANIFRGEMSLVGPRPERPEFVRTFTDGIPKYMLRHKMKSGLTGWAQVHGLRQDTSIEKRLEYDFYYLQNWSYGLDLRILWMTLLRRRFVDKTMP